MKTKLLITIMLFSSLFLACIKQPDTDTYKGELPNPDSSYIVIRTNHLSTTKAKKHYTHKSIGKTQYTIDQSTTIDSAINHKIKIGTNNVLICDSNDNITKELKIKKYTLNKLGPSDDYLLQDENGVEYFFSHYIDNEGNNYLSFRHEKSLQCYINKK